MLVIFIVSAVLLFYVFFGYPIVLYLISLGYSRPTKKGVYEPTVSLIISAYNEAGVIDEKIRNTLAIRYPAEKLEIIVADDGSTDGTDKIVESYGDKVRLLRVEGRKGKVACQNKSVRMASSEVVVFSDANSMYDKNALVALVSNLYDESVGVVCGELRYVRNDESDEGLYWKIERFLKRKESAIGSCLGANGAIYAIRRNLYQDLPADACSDFVEPFFTYAQGYRVIYESEAFCSEHPGDNALEFMRKRRIVSNSFQSLRLILAFLNPFRFGWYSLALWSHKVLRWYAFLFLALVLLVNFFLLDYLLFKYVLALQLCFYGLALVGFFSRAKPFSIPFYFMAVNLASLLAFIDFLFGRKVTAWEKVR